MSPDKLGFLEELKRRHVWRIAVGYAVAAWLLIQIATQVFPFFNIPNWSVRLVVVALAIGFPIAVGLAWVYELTPEGVRRTEPADSAQVRPEQESRQIGRKLNTAIIGVLVAAVALLGWRLLVSDRARVMPAVKAVAAGPAAVKLDTPSAAGSAASAPATAFAPPKGSLVVLPFKNLSGDPKQQYFSDGITEELTGALGQIPDLRVIAWDTASTLRDTRKTANGIGKQLNVANILHGSILRSGDDVRISAELVNTTTGYERWSAHYDGSFKDIFKVQDQVSAAIANALKVRFAQSDLPKGGTTSPEAHELVLKGRALAEKYNAASMEAARKDFEQAVALDPDYADAHAWLSRALLALTEHSDLPLKTTLPRIRAEAEKALALDPRSAGAWLALGNADSSADPPDLAKARSEFRKALALDPSNAGAHLDYGNVLPPKAAMAEETEATLLDPANATAWSNLAADAQDLGDWMLDIQATKQLIQLDPKVVDSAFGLALAYQRLRQNDNMVAAFDLVQPSTPLDRAQVDAGRLTYKALRDPALRPQALAALKSLARHQSNADVASNLMQLHLALGETTPALDILEGFCPADPIACSDLAVSPIYTPLQGHPRFEALAKKYSTL